MSVPPINFKSLSAKLFDLLTADKRNEKILKDIETYIDDNIRSGISRDVATRNFIYINIMSMACTITPNAGGFVYRGIAYSTKDQVCNAIELDLRSKL